MGILKNIFGKKDKPVKSYSDFWAWFQKNEKDFFDVIKQKDRTKIEKGFFDKLSPKLEELKDGYFFLTGMYDDNTVELVLTAEGNTRNIVFVEEIVLAAPMMEGWKFTALKPALGIDDVNIEMAGYKFNGENISFYANELPEYPDEIDITIVHNDFTKDNESKISNGVYIFLDNYLGELDFVTTIDNLTIVGKKEAKKDLIAITKLKDFLNWRQKEFIEKYDGVGYNTEKDSHSILEAELENGNALLAVINTELLNWDSKASHPWVLRVEIKYDGSKNNGMPDERAYNLLGKIQEEIEHELKDVDGYLNIGRQTANGVREIYFACKEFRKPSKVLYQIQQKHAASLGIEYEIYKDKYWQSFKRFSTN
ncbi:MAG: DUF695 domain-containing protein [Bacteroidota bacterium]